MGFIDCYIDYFDADSDPIARGVGFPKADGRIHVGLDHRLCAGARVQR